MAKPKRLILVTGATGKQGSAVLKHLRHHKYDVRALTRDPAKPGAAALAGAGTEVVKGDLEDAESLRRALDGVYGVFAMATFHERGIEGEVREGKALVDAARRAEVSHFVYSSVGAADQNTGIPHFDSKFQIEEHLRRTGLPYTILRPVFFMENWQGMRGMIDQGTLAMPLSPDRCLQQVAVDDIGGITAQAFEHPGKWRGRAVELAGDDLTMSEVTAMFSRTLGREVQYQQVPWDAFEKQAGPEMTVMFRWFQDVGYHADIPALRQEYPELTSLERWLHQNWGTA
ncbi:MAG: NmrA/HSCARG family protein [Bryobacteraceae bacterium]